MSAHGFRLPNASHRVSICGKTGSGKTRGGIWMQGKCGEFDKRPYVMLDFKGDELIAAIDRKRTITVRDIPKHPGLYHLPLNPGSHDALERWLVGVWERGDIGLFIDEGYQISRTSKAFDRILTQGRSLRIPCFTLTQRPVMCSRFVFTEADFMWCFKLSDLEDYKTASQRVSWEAREPGEIWSPYVTLPKYHSKWYDADSDFACELEPVPGDAEILALYSDKLRPPRRML